MSKRVTKNFELKVKRRNGAEKTRMVALGENGKLSFKRDGKNTILRGVTINVNSFARKIKSEGRNAARNYLKNSIKTQLGNTIEYVTIPSLNLNISNTVRVVKAVKKFKEPLPTLNNKIQTAGISMNKNELIKLRKIVTEMNNNNKNRRLGNINSYMMFLNK